MTILSIGAVNIMNSSITSESHFLHIRAEKRIIRNNSYQQVLLFSYDKPNSNSNSVCSYEGLRMRVTYTVEALR